MPACDQSHSLVFDPGFEPAERDAPLSAVERFCTLERVEGGEAFGGQGKIYKVRTSDGLICALKTIKDLGSDSGLTDKDREDLLHEEFLAQRKVSHVHGFPEVYGFGKIQGRPCILMEWVDGVSLQGAKSSLPREGSGVRSVAVAGIGLAVLDILRHVEALGEPLVHRDISPRNIMIRTGETPLGKQAESGRFDVCLIDFGSSTFRNALQPGLTQRVGLARGATAAYAPPELLSCDVGGLDRLRDDASIDVYALCSVLYELYAGRLPYSDIYTASSPYRLKMEYEPAAIIARRKGDQDLVDAICSGLKPFQYWRPTVADLYKRLSDWREKNASRNASDDPAAAAPKGYCPACGARLIGKGFYCSKCGAKIRGRVSADSAQQASAQQVSVQSSGEAQTGDRRSQGNQTPPGRPRASSGPAARRGARNSEVASSSASKASGRGKRRNITRRGAIIAGAGLATCTIASCVRGMLNGGAESSSGQVSASGPLVKSDYGVYVAGRDVSTGRWGLCEPSRFASGAESTSWKVEPAYSEMGRYHYGVAPARDAGSGLWGYVDESGAWVLEPVFHHAGAMSQDGAVASLKSNSWGIVTPEGQWIDVGAYATGDRLVGGRVAARKSSTSSWGFLLSDGSWASDFNGNFSELGEWSSESGVAPAKDGDTGLWGLVGSDGAWVAEPAYREALPVTEGHFFAQSGDSGLWGLYKYSDKTVTRVSDDTFTSVHPMVGGYAPAQYGSDGLWGLFSLSKLAFTLQPTYSDMGEALSVGDQVFYPAKGTADNARWGVVDADGAWYINNKFREIA